jgi:hypothetical protein
LIWGAEYNPYIYCTSETPCICGYNIREMEETCRGPCWDYSGNKYWESNYTTQIDTASVRSKSRSGRVLVDPNHPVSASGWTRQSLAELYIYIYIYITEIRMLRFMSYPTGTPCHKSMESYRQGGSTSNDFDMHSGGPGSNRDTNYSDRNVFGLPQVHLENFMTLNSVGYDKFLPNLFKSCFSIIRLLDAVFSVLLSTYINFFSWTTLNMEAARSSETHITNYQ